GHSVFHHETVDGNRHIISTRSYINLACTGLDRSLEIGRGIFPTASVFRSYCKGPDIDNIIRIRYNHYRRALNELVCSQVYEITGNPRITIEICGDAEQIRGTAHIIQ